MVPDPYKILGVTHDASPGEIKRGYRRLAMKLHPDRLTRRGASGAEIQASTTKFAAVTSSYSLLSDPARKRQYDHIYKYGGYDDTSSSSSPAPRPSKNQSASSTKKPQKGIGYTFTDPVAYVLSRGRVKSLAVAGISVPSRFGMGHSGTDFRVAVSSGKAQETETGTLHCRSTTIEFSGGKKSNKVETTTIHRDGRKEVLIEGDDYVERRFSTAKRRRPRTLQEKIGFGNNLMHGGDDAPWHAQFLKGIGSNIQKCTTNIQRCTNPSLCGAIGVQ
jgi:curved DNA-binding protein CbpA